MTWVIEVDLAAIDNERGRNWWLAYRQVNGDRIRCGADARRLVGCDNQNHAEGLRQVMVDYGVPENAVNVREVAT